MKLVLGILALLTTQPDEAAIRSIVQDEIDAWNRGDAVAYSRHFADRGTFTNIRGQFFTGHAAFVKQHEAIFQGIFKNTRLQQDGRGLDRGQRRFADGPGHVAR
jgi:uncharacterized protein (TIGR02246 family)